MNKFITKVKQKWYIVVLSKVDKRILRSVGFAVTKTSIVAMSYSRKDAMRKLEDLHMQITDHILKILLMPDSSNLTHWKTELQGWQIALQRYNKAKSRSGVNYSEAALRKWLWECPFETSSDRASALKRLRQEGYKLPKEVDVVRLKRAIEKFIRGVLKSNG